MVLATGTESEIKVVDLPMKSIYADNDFNCRGEITPIDVLDLAKDIEKRGLQTPISVQPMENRYRVVAGYRRFTAFKVLKREVIPCIIYPSLSEIEARTLNLGENLIRKELNILQEARSLRTYLKYHFTEKDIANELQQSKQWVRVRLALLNLPEDIQGEAAVGLLNQQQILYVASLPKEKLYSTVKEIKEKKLKGEKFLPHNKPVKKNHLSRKPKTPDEIYKLLDYIITNSEDASIVTRAMAWCAGSINTLEFLRDYKEWVEENQNVTNFPIPREVMEALAT